jgi:hypothetical protein
MFETIVVLTYVYSEQSTGKVLLEDKLQSYKATVQLVSNLVLLNSRNILHYVITIL